MRQLLLFLLFISTFASTGVFAKEQALMTMQTLVDTGQVKLRSGLMIDKNKVANISIDQAVIFYIDIATQRWFSGATSIESISVSNLIAQPQRLQAINYSETLDGKSWSHQRWEISLFPQLSGNYLIPALHVKMRVSIATGKDVEGILLTQPQRFSAHRPTAQMTNPDEWVVASAATLSQTWEISSAVKESPNRQLRVGDAITRRVLLKAPNSLAMLLPALIPPVKNNAVKRYASPFKLKDTNTRGQHLAQREESETYILQQGGELTLPSISIPFWDTRTQTVQKLTLLGKKIQVKHTLSSWFKAYWLVLFTIFSLLALLYLIFNTIKKHYQSHAYPDWLLFLKSINNKDWPLTRLYLYRRLFNKTKKLQLKKHLDSVSSNEKPNEHSEKIQTSTCSPRHLLRIWLKIK
ncbi:hypothetical protein PCNPT3_07040 [Psychromonas sp. CNPT3]|nr:hypothetical protein PCNPT3_07040 [Psychromonas sp. CNPT3]